MKFTVRADVFAEALEPSLSVSMKEADKDFMDITKVTLEAKKSSIVTKAHGGGACICSNINNITHPELNYECIKTGKLTIRSDNLEKCLLSLKNRNLILTIEEQKNGQKISIKTQEKVKNIRGEDVIKKEVQEFGVQIEEVVLPDMPGEFDKEVSIDRDVFIRGIERTYFAIGYADSMPGYLSHLIEVSKKRIRFAAGTGARFAILDVFGGGLSKLTDSKKEISILFPKHNVANLLSLVKQSTTDKVVIKESSNKADFVDQIVVSFQGSFFVFLRIDTDFKYPPLDNIITKDYPYKIKTLLEEWNLPVKGVSATNTTEYQNESARHRVVVSADFDKCYFELEGKTDMLSNRHVMFSDLIKEGRKDEDISFSCRSSYLMELYGRGEGDSDNLTISFENQSAAKDGRCAPVLVEYPEKENSTLNTVDKLSIFFATALLDEDDDDGNDDS